MALKDTTRWQIAHLSVSCTSWVRGFFRATMTKVIDPQQLAEFESLVILLEQGHCMTS
jgi:hypothetical protein